MSHIYLVPLVPKSVIWAMLKWPLMTWHIFCSSNWRLYGVWCVWPGLHKGCGWFVSATLPQNSSCLHIIPESLFYCELKLLGHLHLCTVDSRCSVVFGESNQRKSICISQISQEKSTIRKKSFNLQKVRIWVHASLPWKFDPWFFSAFGKEIANGDLTWTQLSVL